ncbi:alpha-ketoglutarate-dependent dioxygenase AlkB family protein [Agarivorans sp. MS3-6]|uniref:alpha-ketoglutarate-dependent dioxygenase AlkB family protein n=1 Tax=Agarivorans sp. TSD2052 TaxID=2937286 RepID=UPI00200BF34C|nr:alpha-ketoglutarate-dependent dioxygenase AlkB [Agarivorans sp. TSD2052]UPW19636.1 alpha-ketoglutarate-dependent dioxygenase AlkB [Agarivorans sp. TSD2052]
MALTEDIATKQLVHYQHWLRAESAALVYQKMRQQLPWQQHSIKMFGKSCLEPRLSLWVGDADTAYRYSGEWRKPLPWPSFLLPIKLAVQQKAKQPFNSVLLNYYRDGSDYMGWHSDNEKQLGTRPIIASLSIGASRRFLFRHRADKQKIEYQLESGDLLLMNRLCQQQWQHCLPKALRVKQPRINFTFRYTMPVS